LPQGTLDLLILQTLRLGPAHGHTIMQSIKQGSDNVLQVEQGSLYPALHRLIQRDWISFEHIETSKWHKLARAIARLLRPA
jgi:PadR family transcriptional regulator, regulatory protein PadR